MQSDRFTVDGEMLIDYRQKWRDWATPWGPAAGKNPRKFVDHMYTSAGLTPPTKIVVCSSPLSRVILHLIRLQPGLRLHEQDEIAEFLSDVLLKPRSRAWEIFGEDVCQDVKKNVSKIADTLPGRTLGRTIPERLYRRMDKKTSDFFEVGSINVVNGARVGSRDMNSEDVVNRTHFGSPAVWDLQREVSKTWLFDVILRSKTAAFHSMQMVRKNGHIWDSLLLDTKQWYQGCREVYGFLALIRAYDEIAPFADICYLTRRPMFYVTNASGQAHNVEGPAVQYHDGWKSYCLRDVVISRWYWERPDYLNVQSINRITNIEIRSRLIEKYGQANYVKDSAYIVVDECGSRHPLKGLRNARLLGVPAQQWSREPEVFTLELTNSSPEPDGTYKKYYLAVNPNHYHGRAGREVLAAAASMHRKFNDPSKLAFATPEQYKPMVET